MSGIETSEGSKLAFEIVSGMAGRRFGFFGFDRGEARRIEIVMQQCGALAVSFPDNVMAQSAHFCDALAIRVLGLCPGALRAAAALNLPVLAVIPSNSLASGTGGAYGWPRDFMVEPWTDEELVVRLFRMTAPSEEAMRKVREPRKEPLVLLADDDPELSALVHATLRNDGISYRNVDNGLACLRLARELAPDLIVLDVRMPDMNGFAVLETIREDPALQSIPVMLLTGCDEQADVARGAALRADDYLVKPVSPNVLLNRLRRLLAACGRGSRRWNRMRSEGSNSSGKPAQRWAMTENVELAKVEAL